MYEPGDVRGKIRKKGRSNIILLLPHLCGRLKCCIEVLGDSRPFFALQVHEMRMHELRVAKGVDLNNAAPLLRAILRAAQEVGKSLDLNS